jgi:hypothetical protein
MTNLLTSDIREENLFGLAVLKELIMFCERMYEISPKAEYIETIDSFYKVFEKNANKQNLKI